MADEKPIDRRRFFREGLRELLKPLANATEPIERALKELEALDTPCGATACTASAAATKARLAASSRRAGRAEIPRHVQPLRRVRLGLSGPVHQDRHIRCEGKRRAYIVASEMACVVCDGLHCMQNCPSGALVFTPAADIDMGTAEWHEHLCVRPHGEDCKICVEQCPIGAVAIELDEAGKVKVHEDGCIGCGVCEQQCPTAPKSITIRPRAQI